MQELFFEHLQAPACFGHQTLSPMQTDATMLANNSQHCWMLHVTQTQHCWMLHVTQT